MSTSTLLCGVGGQGTVLASRLIAFAAMRKGEKARTAETIGMSQRGGCVVSHVRTGEEVFSPLIPEGGADVIIGFEPNEAVRCIKYLKQGGIVAVSSKSVQPVTASLTGKSFDSAEMISFLQHHAAKVIVVDTDKVCAELGSTKVMNTILLGAAAASGMLGFTVEEIIDAIKERVPEKFHALNIAAVKAGAACCK